MATLNTVLRECAKAIVKQTFLYPDIVLLYRRKTQYWKWLKSGKSIPTPHGVKEMAVKEYADKSGARVFVETGTCHGTMLYAVQHDFDAIYSVELDTKLYEEATSRFSPYPHIRIINGDSAKVLPEVLESVHEQCLFWLDAHYSGGFTAKGEKETPVLEELKHIFNHFVNNHVILIDDAHCFTGENDYPPLHMVRRLVSDTDPELQCEVKDDIIRIHKDLCGA